MRGALCPDERPETIQTLRHRVFCSLCRASPDDLPSRLRLKYCRLLGERIDALPRLCGGLLDDNEFCETWHKEGSRFLEFFVAYFRERLDDALYVLPRHTIRMLLSDFLNEHRLRHQLGHVPSPNSESACDYVSLKFAVERTLVRCRAPILRD